MRIHHHPFTAALAISWLRGQQYGKAAALSVLLAAAPALWAQDALLQNAQQLIGDKQAAQAYAVLSAQESARAGQPDFDFLLGVAALDSGRVTQAIFAFERVLAVKPDHSLARAELARAYVASGERDTARSQLLQVSQAPDVPASARQSIQRMLASLSDAERKKLRWYVEAGFGHDSNLSGGPNLTSFAVPSFAAPWTLNPSSKQRGGAAWQLGSGLTFNHALSGQSELTGQLNWRTNQPTKHKDLDTRTLDASLGWGTLVGANRYNISLNLGQLHNDGKALRRQQGVQGQWLRELTSGDQIMAFVQHTQMKYQPSPSNRDVGRTVFGGAWGRALSEQASTYLGLTLGREAGRGAASSDADLQFFGLRLGGEYAISEPMRAFASLGMEQRSHKQPDVFFLDKRRDRQVDLAIGVNYQLAPTSYGQWKITPQLTHTTRNSNIVIYDLKRSQIGITARLDF